ncbi:MAG TPA: DNA mismatch repair endonuclease MutL [Ktedonobacterales bacterium]|jgi:DNA mismatch repair protein MutL|nr:DNA mismatch repair endonuclease MutL [Ktedonobacterales bacterium]
MPILQLPPEIAAKIAAGEVVERPASVVKELVENALDAGAASVRVELEGGGLDLIRVVDDGRGIAADEMGLAFVRHATSKIATLDDLERIRTLGFRGEALASVSAVARVTVASRARGADVGAQLTVEEGRAGPVVAAGAPNGTSVTVRGLFSSMPARLKFLKTRATETGHSLRLLEQYAMAYPGVRFTAVSEGREVFHTSGDGKLLNVLVAVYGLSVAEQMTPIGETALPPDDRDVATVVTVAPPDPDRPRVGGYVSKPTCYKATRQYLSFFVNGRWVQSRSLSYAVEEAYHSLLLAGRHPIAVVNLTLDPWLLDVNVHPAKTEVKFLRERQVYAAVQRAARAAVIESASAPEVSPRVFSIPAWEPVDAHSASSSALSEANGDAARPSEAVADESTASTAATGAAAAASLWAAQGRIAAGERINGFTAPGAPAADEVIGGARMPALRVLGQVSQAYIIAEGPDGVYMVDQHAAHERILLEKMIAEWRSQAVASQLLLEPAALELSPAEREHVEEHLDALRRIGFEIEPFGDEAILTRAVPAMLAGKLRGQSLRELIVALAGADADAASHGETWEEHALANVACKAAIKAGQTLTPDEQREMVRQLEGASAYQSCCHGRPTLVKLSLTALEREFDRR